MRWLAWKCFPKLSKQMRNLWSGKRELCYTALGGRQVRKESTQLPRIALTPFKCFIPTFGPTFT